MSYTFVKVGRARNPSGEGEHWRDEQVSPTVNLFDIGDMRTVVALVDVKDLEVQHKEEGN